MSIVTRMEPLHMYENPFINHKRRTNNTSKIIHSFHPISGLIAIVLSYLSDGFYTVASQISSNEINHKSSRFNYDYCEPGLCASNKKHIACGNKGKFGQSCTSDAHVVELDDYYKRLILYMHNLHRNTIAMGKTPGYQPAARMGALQWDDGEQKKFLECSRITNDYSIFLFLFFLFTLKLIYE